MSLKASELTITLHKCTLLVKLDWLVLTHKKATTCGTAMIITQLSAE